MTVVLDRLKKVLYIYFHSNSLCLNAPFLVTFYLILATLWNSKHYLSACSTLLCSEGLGREMSSALHFFAIQGQMPHPNERVATNFIDVIVGLHSRAQIYQGELVLFSNVTLFLHTVQQRTSFLTQLEIAGFIFLNLLPFLYLIFTNYFRDLVQLKCFKLFFICLKWILLQILKQFNVS